MHSRISRLHLWHGGLSSPPSGPVPRMHFALRWRQLMHALYARLKSSGWVRFLLAEDASSAPRAALGSWVVVISQAGGVRRGWRRNKAVKTGSGNDWK